MTNILLLGPPTDQQQPASLWQETADDEENVETNPERCAPAHRQVEHRRNLLPPGCHVFR